MPVATGTATDQNDLLADLIAFLTTAGPTGPGWTLLNSASGSHILHAPGLSGSDEIGVGFSTVSDLGTDSFALKGWMFQDYNPALPHEAQPGHSGTKYHPIWNTSMPYWFIANGQRVIVITKISTVYTASYLGKFLPWGAPGEYPQPYYIGMPRNSNVRWSSTNENYRNFFDPGEGAVILLPTGAWHTVANFQQLSVENPFVNNAFVWPYSATIDNSMPAHARYRELRENIDGTYNTKPCILCSNDPADDIYGSLDGVFAINAFSAAAEDVHQVGSDNYLIIPNCFRSERYYYATAKLA